MFEILNKKTIDEYVKQYLPSAHIDIDYIWHDFLVSYNTCKNKNVEEIISPTWSTIDYLLFRIYSMIYQANKNESIINQYKNQLHTLYIDISCKIGNCPNLFDSTNIFIEKNVVIGNNVNFANNIKIGRGIPQILNNVNIGNNVKIYGNIKIGNNVNILDDCYITENIDDNLKVEIINQLQVVSKEVKNYLPSQTISVYGVVPKFKNCIHIIGDGFYNPIVTFKNCKELDYYIPYWDKNKIIIKFRNTKPIKADNVIITLLSHRTKVTILNSIGLSKALLNLTS